ncbi:hypothetical protein BKA69DRAFT_1059298 [Paraphysoderma sedebokerense]|nr:hypothetical protein BKA69DRAFT_1059298 [Paraphysoderma sedebokerense]
MSADVAMTSVNQLTISSSLQIQNPFPVSLSIGSVSVATLLNNQQFVSVVLPPINLRQGSNNLDLNNIQINLGTSNALPPAVANIVSGFLEKRDIADTLAITGLSISSPSNVEAAKIIAFSKVSVPLNLNSLRQGLESPSAGSLIDTSVILPSPLTIPTPRLLNASVDTQPQATIALSASLSYTNPLPVSIRIPYISLDGSVNGGRLVSVSISGLDIQRGGGSKQLGLRVNLRFNNEERAMNDVASIVSRVMNNQALDGVSVGVAQVILGTSAEAVTQLLSQVRVNLDAQPLMEKLKSAGGGGEGLLPPIDTKSLDPKLSNLKIVTQPDKQLSVSLSAAITNPLPISLDIGYLSATVNVNGAPIFAAALSNIRLGQARNNMELSLSLRFFDGQPSQDAVANLVREIMSSSQWQSTIGIGSPVVGASASDTIRTFSKVEVNMPLTNFIVPGNLRSLSLPSLGGTGGQSPVSLKSGDIKVLPSSRIQIAASLGLNIEVPVTVDIGYVSLSALISDVPAVDITLNGLKVTPGTKDLNLNLDIRIRDEPGLSDKLSALFDAVLNKKEITEVLGISSIAFGSSANDKDRIDTLRKANIAIPLTNFDTNGLALPTLGGGLPASFKDFNVNFKTGDVVDLSLTANLGFSFPLSVDVGYLSVTAQLDDTKVVSVRLNGLKITPQTKDLSLALSLQFYDSAALEDKIAALVRSVLRKEPAAGNLVLSGLQIGVSPQDYIRALEKASVPIQLQKLVGGLQIPTIGPISGGNTTIPFDIKELKAVFAANDRIEFGVKTGLKITFPASVNIGFIAVALQVDNVPALSVHVKQLALSPTTKELSIQIAVQVEDSPQLADKLAVLFDDLLRKKFDHTITITGVRAGVSQDDHISALSKVAYPLNLQQLFSPSGNQESTLSLPMPSSNFVSDLVQKVGLNVSEADIQTLPDRRVTATVRASFSNPFPIDVQLGYASVMIGVDNTDVVSLNLGGLRMGQGSNSLTLTVGAQLSTGDASAQTLGKFVTDLLSGTIGEHTVMIKSLILGPSREDSIMALSKSNVNLPVKMILTPEKLKELLDKLPKLLPQPGAGGIPAGIGLTGGNVDITKGGKISIPLRGSVPKNLPVKMSIGFVALNVALDRITFVRIGIRDLQVVPAEGRFALTLDIGLSNVGNIPGKIAEIIKALITKGQLPDMEVGLTNLLLGSSVEDHSNIFSRIFVPLRLRALIPAGGPSLPKIKIPEPDVIQINVEEDPTDAEAFILKIPITFKQPVSPIGLSLGYAHVKVSIDKVDALDIDLREFSLQENSQKLDLNIRGKGLSEEGIALLGKIIENQGQGVSANLLLSDVFFGASKTDNFDILSAVQLPLTLGNSTGTPMELPPVTVGGKPLNELMKSISIGQVLGNVNHDGLKTMVDVNARLPINVVGIHGLDAQIFFKNQPIFAIEARNLKVVANQNPHVDALLKPLFPAATDAFSEIYELIKANKSVADLSAGGIVIHSSKGSSRMFSKLRLNVPPSHVEDPKIIGGPDFGRMFTQFQVGTKVRCVVPVTFPTDINLGNVRFEVESNMRKSSFTQDREYGLMGVVDDQDVHLTDKIQGFHAFIKNKIINPLKLVAAMQDINSELKYLKNIRTYVDGRQVTWLSTMLAKTNVRVVVELKLRGV